MSQIEIVCPGCNILLKLPATSAGKKGRCLGCGAVFTIVGTPKRVDPVEEAVFGWLEGPLPPAEPSGKLGTYVPTVPPKTSEGKPPHKEPRALGTAKGASGKTFAVHLDHVDVMGAFLNFAPQLLYDEQFRSVFPHRCILCGAQGGLSVYLVHWSSKLTGSKGAPAESRRPIKRLEELGGLSGPALLAKLQPLENLPQPYCLPMPYYVCEGCSPVGAILAEVHPDQAGQEHCVLGISSLAQAQIVLAAMRGMDCPDLQRIRNVHYEGPLGWHSLPLTVRIRINQWYKPQEGEQFQAYIPDQEFSKAEAGLAGLVVTNRRLVFRRATDRLELSHKDQISLTFHPDGTNVRLQLNSASNKAPINLLVHEATLQQLRSCLSKYRC